MSAVPKLRFPEFDGEWEETTLNEQAISLDRRRKPVRSADRSQGPYPYYGASGVIDYIDDYIFDEETVLLAEDGANILNRSTPISFIATGKYWVNNHAHVYAARYSSVFLSTALERIDYTNYNTGTTMPKLNGQTCASLPLICPPADEQQKIASFLCSVGKKIDLIRRKKKEFDIYKKCLIQKLFSQEIRFKQDDGNNFPDWEDVALGDVLQEHKEKSSGTETVFSVSVSKGLVDQVEHLGRSFSAAVTNHYNKVKPGDVVYTKSPTGSFPLGIIKQSNINVDVIVSPLYGVFTPETKHLGKILDTYFESEVNVGNYLMPLVQKGAKNTIACTNRRFLEGRIVLPRSADEQQKIASFLSAIDSKIQKTSSQIEEMEAFRNGLLQQMFV